jgi:predicted porin
MLRVNGVSATGSSEFRILNLGVRVPFGAFTAIAQAARVQDRTAYAAPTGNRDSTWLAIGAEYAFSRRTVGYASIGRIGNRNGSQYALGAGTAQQAANFVASANQRSTGVAVGMRHSF